MLCDDARVHFEVSSRKTRNVHLFTRHGARRGASPEKARGLALCRITLLFDIKRALGALYRVFSGQDRHDYLSHNTEMRGGVGVFGDLRRVSSGRRGRLRRIITKFLGKRL